MNIQMSMVNSSHTLEAIFQVMRVAVKLAATKIALQLNSTLATPPIYDGASPEKLATASPGYPVGVTKPSFLLLFEQQDKKSLEESKSPGEPIFFDNFRRQVH